MTEHRGYSVSYRNAWWKRRLYGAGNIDENEAWTFVRYLIDHGYKRVRVEADL